MKSLIGKQIIITHYFCEEDYYFQSYIQGTITAIENNMIRLRDCIDLDAPNPVPINAHISEGLSLRTEWFNINSPHFISIIEIEDS